MKFLFFFAFLSFISARFTNDRPVEISNVNLFCIKILYRSVSLIVTVTFKKEINTYVCELSLNIETRKLGHERTGAWSDF